ncbi:MAG: glycosyltransferase family 9 protein [Roseiflexaceae bacterium]|nr:glycosyltransferase family 9 protein [Roseiflexaceae bacterium]
MRLLLLHLLALLARPFVRQPARQVRRILYIKPDHLGDLLLATPVLAALRESHPEAQITALVGPWARMVLERNPSVDVLLVCPFPGFERADRTKHKAQSTTVTMLYSLCFVLCSRVKPYLVLLKYAALLRPAGYDLAIIGRDDHWWGAALALLAGVPERVGFAVAECRPLLSRALPWNPADHVTRQGLALVGASNQRPTNKQQQTSFTPAPSDLAWAAGWLAAQLRPGERLVIIHPGTGGPAKHWLDDRWSEVATALAGEPGLRVALTGGPGEEGRVAAIVAGMRGPAIDLAGQTSVGQLAALMGSAALVLGVDSGPLHLAAATGVRTIHLYGPGDEARFGPWGDAARNSVLHSELWCRPCGVFSACPRGLAVPECMERIAAHQVRDAAFAALH